MGNGDYCTAGAFNGKGFLVAIFLYGDGLVFCVVLKDGEPGIGLFIEPHPVAFAGPFVKYAKTPYIP
jgi:hypothetical protein